MLPLELLARRSTCVGPKEMSIGLATRSHTFSQFQQGVEALLNVRQFSIEPLFTIVGLSHYFRLTASKANRLVACFDGCWLLLAVLTFATWVGKKFLK